MNDLTYISEKKCQICHVNKEEIKNSLNIIESLKYNIHANPSAAPIWNFNMERINKYNNGDYKDFIDEYNAHWCCIPKVNQIDYNERIEKKIKIKNQKKKIKNQKKKIKNQKKKIKIKNQKQKIKN